MRILLMVPDCSRNDPLWPALAEAFEQRLSATTAVNYGEPYDGDAVDLVLPFDEMLTTWYAMRASIPGRYRVIGCAFRFLDLYEFMRSFKTVSESGLSALFSNCKSFISQFGQGCPSSFTYRPVVVPVSTSAASRKYPFVSVIDKVADQDFSFADRVSRKYGNKYVIFALSGALSDFPTGIADRVVPVTDSEPESTWYQHGSVYIPTPRITDYRGGIIPIEYFKAARYGCRLMLTKHPLTLEFGNVVSGIPLYESMTSLDAALDSSVACAPPVLPDVSAPTPKQFAAQISTAYKRLEATGVAR